MYKVYGYYIWDVCQYNKEVRGVGRWNWTQWSLEKHLNKNLTVSCIRCNFRANKHKLLRHFPKRNFTDCVLQYSGTFIWFAIAIFIYSLCIIPTRLSILYLCVWFSLRVPMCCCHCLFLGFNKNKNFFICW